MHLSSSTCIEVADDYIRTSISSHSGRTCRCSMLAIWTCSCWTFCETSFVSWRVWFYIVLLSGSCYSLKIFSPSCIVIFKCYFKLVIKPNSSRLRAPYRPMIRSATNFTFFLCRHYIQYSKKKCIHTYILKCSYCRASVNTTTKLQLCVVTTQFAAGSQ